MMRDPNNPEGAQPCASSQSSQSSQHSLSHSEQRSTRAGSRLTENQREALLRLASRSSGDPHLDAMNRAVVGDLLEDR